MKKVEIALHRIKNLCECYPFKNDNMFGIIQHPLVNFGFFTATETELNKYGINPDPTKTIKGNDGNGGHWIGIQINADNYRTVSQIIYERMAQEKEVIGIIMRYINKPYWLPFFVEIQDLLTEEEYNLFLADIWILTEFPHQNGVIEMLGLFKKSNPKLLMTGEGTSNDYEVYNRLPNQIKVYRGIQNDKHPTIRGLSWTLSPKVAEWFAGRFSKSGVVYSATIRKDKVFCYINGRNEEELVVNPYYLKEITVFKIVEGKVRKNE